MTLTVTLTPKINQPGASPAPSTDASSYGTATLSPSEDRTVTISRRRRGTSDPWETVKSAASGPDGVVPFIAWGDWEYRATAPASGNKAKVESDVATYDWSSLFVDEFDGSALAPHWTHRGQEYRADSPLLKGDPRAVEVSGGVARIMRIADPDKPGSYLGGHIGTQQGFRFTSGWAAARVRFHKRSGAHAAFWLQSVTGYMIGDTEVDVAEYFGYDFPVRDDGLHPMRHNLYWSVDADKDPESSWKRSSPETYFDGGVSDGDHFYNSYHVYSVNWTPEGYDFYIDGKRIKSTTEATSISQHFLVLSMQSKDYEDHRNAETAERTMSVDWVRVWA